MQGLVSECLQYRDSKTQLQIIKLRHSYNVPAMYENIPVTILSGIKNLGVSYENGYYQCRWIVESAVEYSYELGNGSIVTRQEDLGYKNYHILLASGEYNEGTDGKAFIQYLSIYPSIYNTRQLELICCRSVSPCYYYSQIHTHGSY